MATFNGDSLSISNGIITRSSRCGTKHGIVQQSSTSECVEETVDPSAACDHSAGDTSICITVCLAVRIRPHSASAQRESEQDVHAWVQHHELRDSVDSQNRSLNSDARRYQQNAGLSYWVNVCLRYLTNRVGIMTLLCFLEKLSRLLAQYDKCRDVYQAGSKLNKEDPYIAF